MLLDIPEDILLFLICPYLNIPELIELKSISKKIYSISHTVLFKKANGFKPSFLKLLFTRWVVLSKHKSRSNSWSRSLKNPERYIFPFLLIHFREFDETNIT